MSELKLDPAVIDSVAGTLRNINENTEKVIEQSLRPAVTSLFHNWSGGASDHAKDVFVGMMKAYSQPRYDILDNYVKALEQLIKTGYLTVEEANTSLADQFK